MVNIDLVFPLNDTYAPQDGPLPIVFALSPRPFQPSLASTLQLHLSYVLLDTHNQSRSLASGDFDLGKLSSSSVDNPHFFFGYSDRLVGRASQFALQCTVSLMASFTSTDNNSTVITDPNLIYNAYLTTQTGSQPADVPSSVGDKTTCLPHASWSMAFDVNDYVQNKSDTFALLAPNSPSFASRQCAVKVDAASTANITSGIPTTTTTPSSPSGAATSTAGILSGSGIMAVFWSLLMLGLSAGLIVR